MPWTGLYCGAGANVVTIDASGRPYVLMQREVWPQSGILRKWAGTGGSVRDELITFPKTSDVNVVRGCAPHDSEFRAAAVREASEETNGVVQLDPHDLVMTNQLEIPHRKKFPGEYLISRTYVGVLGSDDHEAIEEAIEDGSISGHMDRKGTVVAAHVLVPVEQILKLSFPQALSGFDTTEDRAAWNKYRGSMHLNTIRELNRLLTDSRRR